MKTARMKLKKRDLEVDLKGFKDNISQIRIRLRRIKNKDRGF